MFDIGTIGGVIMLAITIAVLLPLAVIIRKQGVSDSE